MGDAAWALDQWSGAADAWFLDGFSPALNPGMWSDAVLDGMAARSAPGARVATFTVAGTVRRGLAERGFQVDKRPGHGRKRERLEAVLPGEPPRHDGGRVAVIGAGIAGASLARALRAQGADPVVIADDTAMASGFPAALATPRLDVGDEDLARLFAQALERAGQLYGEAPDAIVARGVLRLEHGPRDSGRFDKVAGQAVWAPGAMTRVSAAEASGALGETVTGGGLMMQGALTVRPAAVLDAGWQACGGWRAGRRGWSVVARRGGCWMTRATNWPRPRRWCWPPDGARRLWAWRGCRLSGGRRAGRIWTRVRPWARPGVVMRRPPARACCSAPPMTATTRTRPCGTRTISAIWRP